MSKLTRATKKIIKNPAMIYSYLNGFGFLKNLSDEKWAKLMWKAYTGKEINLENPQTFNEKLQWLKLYDRRPEYTVMADKILAKDYVAERIGNEYIIPTIATYNNPEEINIETLPNQFVLKCNHNSGAGMYICKDKTRTNIEQVKKNLKNGLEENYYKAFREWPYKDITRKILAEKFMKDSTGRDLIDYKFYCFEGEPKFLNLAKTSVVNNVKVGLTAYYDLNWNMAEFQRNDHERLTQKIDKPKNFDKMIEFSRILSRNTHFLRVDWYEIDGKLYFGEMTFFPGAGFGFFSPEEYEKKFGDYIKLSSK